MSRSDWTLHDIPTPPHPSYRCLTALRLFELSESIANSFQEDDPFSVSSDLRAWQDTIWGEREFISELNEEAMRGRLYNVCEIITKRAEEKLLALRTQAWNSDRVGWLEYAVKCIEELWKEERRVANGIRRTIEAGEAKDW